MKFKTNEDIKKFMLKLSDSFNDDDKLLLEKKVRRYHKQLKDLKKLL